MSTPFFPVLPWDHFLRCQKSISNYTSAIKTSHHIEKLAKSPIWTLLHFQPSFYTYVVCSLVHPCKSFLPQHTGLQQLLYPNHNLLCKTKDGRTNFCKTKALLVSQTWPSITPPHPSWGLGLKPELCLVIVLDVLQVIIMDQMLSLWATIYLYLYMHIASLPLQISLHRTAKLLTKCNIQYLHVVDLIYL